ncbi:hypothetical protein CCP3SC1AL1_110040 [Gammaproteobacteria bacterium]
MRERTRADSKDGKVCRGPAASRDIEYDREREVSEIPYGNVIYRIYRREVERYQVVEILKQAGPVPGYGKKDRDIRVSPKRIIYLLDGPPKRKRRRKNYLIHLDAADILNYRSPATFYLKVDRRGSVLLQDKAPRSFRDYTREQRGAVGVRVRYIPGNRYLPGLYAPTADADPVLEGALGGLERYHVLRYALEVGNRIFPVVE